MLDHWPLFYVGCGCHAGESSNVPYSDSFARFQAYAALATGARGFYW